MEEQMKIDGAKIRRLRDIQGWSQEQLAEAAGVSLRTVQRAEAQGTASRETRVCLAAALGIAHTELDLHETDAPSVGSRGSDSGVALQGGGRPCAPICARRVRSNGPVRFRDASACSPMGSGRSIIDSPCISGSLGRNTLGGICGHSRGGSARSALQ
jgi:DNA-binding XRE family transcriptional regulator